MASRKVSLCKFVGTVTLGLMTGASYTLTTLTIPSLLELPSASSAAKAFRSLSSTASAHLNILSTVGCSAFLLAMGISPPGFRHPYLLYAAVFCFGTRLSGYVTPMLMSSPSTSAGTAQRRAAAAQLRKEKAAARRMEQSYEMLPTDAHSDEGASISGEEPDDDVNGEEVRAEVQTFVKNQLVQTIISGIGFAMAVVGIWGDGVPAQAVFIEI